MSNAKEDAARATKGCLMLLIIPAACAMTVCVLGLFRSALASPEQRAEWSAEQAEASRRKEIEAAFSPWDGAHIELKKIIKSVMQDPGSFECIDSHWIDMVNGNIKVTMVYAGTNAYGARVQESITAECRVSGEVVRVY